jgi:hypothetical protein
MSTTLMTQIINKVTYFSFFIHRFRSRFLNLQIGRLYEKSCPFKRVNKVPCLLTCCCWLLPLNLPFYFLKRTIFIWGIAYSVARILFEYHWHPNKCSFCLQGNPSLLIMDFIHWWKPTRECCNWRLINCVVRFNYKCISGLPSFLWPRFPN